MMATKKNVQEIENFVQWRQKLYHYLGIRKSAQMDLVDALSSNRDAHTVVELSLNPLFRRKYQSIYQAIKNFTSLEKEVNKKGNKDELLSIILETIPSNNQRGYHLLGIDTTPNPRQFSPSLSERKFIHQPNSIKGNKPINIGHTYSWLSYLPEKEKNFDSAWTIPLSVARVKSDEKADARFLRSPQKY